MGTSGASGAAVWGCCRIGGVHSLSSARASSHRHAATDINRHDMMLTQTENNLLAKLLRGNKREEVQLSELSRSTNAWTSPWHVVASHVAKNPEGSDSSTLRQTFAANADFPHFADRPSALCRDDAQYLQRANSMLRLALNEKHIVPSIVATALECQLLLQSFQLPSGTWKTMLDDQTRQASRPSHIDMTVFLVRSGLQADSAKGMLASLKLWLVRSACAPGASSPVKFHRAPGSFLLPLAETFRSPLTFIEESFAQTLTPLSSESLQIVWDLSLIESEVGTLWGVDGGSASAAFALGAYQLLRDIVADEAVRLMLEDVDVARIGVTAQVVKDWQVPWPRIDKVNGVSDKWLGLADWHGKLGRRRVVPLTLLVAPEQWHDMNEPHDVQPIRAAAKEQFVDLRDLFRTAQDLTGEKLGVKTRELWRRVREKGQPGPDDQLVEEVLEERQNPPRGFNGYLLHRYALRASGSHIAFWLGKEAARRAAHASVKILVDPERNITDRAASNADANAMHGECESLSKLLAGPGQPHAWVLTGAPGSGKTYLLADFEKECSSRLLSDESSGDATQDHVNPHYVTAWFSLSDFNVEAHDAHAELVRIWARTYPHYSFERFLADTESRHLSLVLIFDAINESKGKTNERIGMLNVLREWLQTMALQQRSLAGSFHALFSVRTMESIRFYDGASGFTERQAALKEWTREDSLQYVKARMSPGLPSRKHLVAALSDQRDSVKARAFVKLMSSPALLAAQCTLLETKLVSTVFDSDAKLLTALAMAMLHIEFKKPNGLKYFAEPLFSADDLKELHEGELSTMLQPQPRLPNDGLYIRWVEGLASSMQRAGERSTALSWKESVEVVESTDLCVTDRKMARDLTAQVGWIRKVTAGAANSSTPSDDLLRWSHERWRELFAARALDTSDGALGQYAMPALNPPTQKAFAEQLKNGNVSVNWRTPVSEQQESLLFMMDTMEIKRSTKFITSLTKVNLTLAARCAQRLVSRLEPIASHQGWDKSAALEKKYGAADVTLKALRAELLVRFTQPVLAPERPDDADAYEDIRHRLDWGLLLGELHGDARFELREGHIDGKAIPYLRPKTAYICQIGSLEENTDYWIGNTLSANKRDDEGPLTKISTKGFRVSAFPLTNAEYRFFVEARGYEDERWWHSQSARDWLKNFRANRGDEPLQPRGWDRPNRGNDLQPVVGIAWYEANAYAAWVDALEHGSAQAIPSGDEDRIRLLTEGQWRAAAGGEGKHYGPEPKQHRRRWPYGAGNGQQSPETDPLRINFERTKLNQSSPVGLFARGKTPEGVEDLGGNVWEWTASEYTEKLESKALITTQDQAQVSPLRITLAGGNDWDEASLCRVAYRDGGEPVFEFDSSRGARLCGWRAPIIGREGTEP